MNASAISRALNAAGIRKSSSRKGRIMRITSEGFEVENLSSGGVLIKYRKHSELSWSIPTARESWLNRKAEARKAIEAVLEAKGFKFEVDDLDFVLRIWVRD